jgi:hypothetical protein
MTRSRLGGWIKYYRLFSLMPNKTQLYLAGLLERCKAITFFKRRLSALDSLDYQTLHRTTDEIRLAGIFCDLL